MSQDEEGMRRSFKQFSFPGGIPSHVAPETPGSIHEGGELGYSLAMPMARHSTIPISSSPASWATARPRPGRWPQPGTRTSSSIRCTTGRCCRYCISTATRSPTRPCFARIARRTRDPVAGYGYDALFVEGDDPGVMHKKMAATLETMIAEIKDIQKEAAAAGKTSAPRWPMIVLRTPKGWTGPRRSTGTRWKASGARTRCHSPTWRKPGARRAARGVDEELPAGGAVRRTGSSARTGRACPRKAARMGANPHANGGLLLQDLRCPISATMRSRSGARRVTAEATRVMGGFLRDVMQPTRQAISASSVRTRRPRTG